MNFKVLFDTQEVLDHHINEVSGISGEDVMQERMLALLVEIGEFANETRCFKFWSKKPASKKVVILEEYVDCMHFLLSIGNYSGFTFRSGIDMDFIEDLGAGGNTTELFIGFFMSVVDFRNMPTPIRYLGMWDYFMSIGKKLGFSHDDMFNAYMQKNEVNHERQVSGY